MKEQKKISTVVPFLQALPVGPAFVSDVLTQQHPDTDHLASLWYPACICASLLSKPQMCAQMRSIARCVRFDHMKSALARQLSADVCRRCSLVTSDCAELTVTCVLGLLSARSLEVVVTSLARWRCRCIRDHSGIDSHVVNAYYCRLRIGDVLGKLFSYACSCGYSLYISVISVSRFNQFNVDAFHRIQKVNILMALATT